MTVTRKKTKPSRQPKIEKICEAATVLGVSREHLTRGLRGERPISNILLHRYHDLKAIESEMSANTKSK